MTDRKATPKIPTPKCLGQTGTTRTGRPVYAVQRTDGLVVEVVIPGREEEEETK